MYSRPSPVIVAGYQGSHQAAQSPYRQGFASAPPIVAQSASARTWEGGVLMCCGSGDGSGWATCLIGAFFPCILYGKLRERAFGQSCFCWGLLFFLLSCLTFMSADQTGYDSYYSFYYFPPYAKTLTLLFLGMALVLLGASTRSAIRRRFGLPGSDCQDFCLWFWCPSCALCQEARTLEKNNVVDGEWFGQTRYLPVLTQPPTPQAQTPHGPHTPQPLTPPATPQSHASAYGYRNPYQPPAYQHAGYQPPMPSQTSVGQPAPSAPPIPRIPFLEADHRAPTV